METRKSRVEKSLHIAVAIFLLIGTPYLVMCALWQKDVLTFIDTFGNVLPLVGSLTLGKIVYVASALLQAAFRVFACGFLFGLSASLYLEPSRSSRFARLRKSFLLGLQAGCLAVPIGLPYAIARILAPILGSGL